MVFLVPELIKKLTGKKECKIVILFLSPQNDFIDDF